MERYINDINDLIMMLDNYTLGIDWEEFYGDKKRKPPFIVQYEMPDENLVEFININKNCVNKAIEFGCGEGRNSIFMAKQGIQVTGYDISENAIKNAIKIANEKQVMVEFRAENALTTEIESNSIDLVYDAGMFHHLAPHRRITYFELINRILKKDAYFAMTCFASGENVAEEIDDWEYYKEKRFGVAFSEQRLIDFWGRKFDVVYIRRYRDGIPNTLQGESFMWTCLFQKK